MELDLTRLNKLAFTDFKTGQEKQTPESPVEPLLSGGLITLPEQEKPVEGFKTGLNGIPQEDTPPEQAKLLLIDAQREREDRQRCFEVYRMYQENIKRSGQLQTEILKGIKAGENVYSLFLKAAKAISLMTSNTVFYNQIEKDTRSIYGRGLNQKPPLQNELQDAQQRLQRLIEAEQRETQPDSRERIRRAITAHREYIAEVKAMIDRE